MVYLQGQSRGLYSSASILMIYLCICHHIMQNVTCLQMTPHYVQQKKALCKFKKTLQHCLNRISVWCNTNHMIINPVKTKSMVITTQQKHQLPDLLLRLSFDCQNIENVTEHRLLSLIVDNKFRWQVQIEYICKNMSKKLFLLSQLQHIINIDTRKFFYSAHIKPHIDYASVVWGGCVKVHLKNNN